FPRLSHFVDDIEVIESDLFLHFRDRFNEVLLSFTRIVNQLKQNIIVFLDDLQWADEGTIGFLNMWLSEGEGDNLFFIGSFRSDNNDSDIWLLAEETLLAKDKFHVPCINLSGLSLNDIGIMISDVFEMQE